MVLNDGGLGDWSSITSSESKGGVSLLPSWNFSSSIQCILPRGSNGMGRWLQWDSLTFSSSLTAHISQAQRGTLGSLSRSPSERMINRWSPGPSPVEQQAGSSAGNKREILSPQHSRGYNEACTKQTGESQPDKQFHFQSSAEREIAILSPAATYRCWTQQFRD